MDIICPPSPRHTTTTNPLCDNFYVWLLGVFCLFGLIGLCIWLSISKNPTTSITEIVVPTDNNGSSPISYTVEFENPNTDAGIYYDDVVLLFLLGDDSVGDTKVGSFYQGKRKTHVVKGNLNADSGIMARLREKILVAKTELKLRLQTRIRFKTWGMKGKHHGLDLQGRIPIGSDGKISGKKKKIKLHYASSSKKFKFKGKISLEN